jgi:hypothetical protein
VEIRAPFEHSAVAYQVVIKIIINNKKINNTQIAKNTEI